MELREIPMTKDNKQALIASMFGEGWEFVNEKRKESDGTLIGVFKEKQKEKKVLFD